MSTQAADAAMPAGSAPAREVSLPRSYLWRLLLFICFATLFEGYDLLIINLALPSLGQEFGASSRTLGLAVGTINVGTIAAFWLVRLADVHGRRPVFLLAAGGYTLFTVLTIASRGLVDFIAYQFVARMFMVTEIGVGAIILTEELPARYRGAGVTLMFTLSLLGGVGASAIFPWAIDTSLGWRALYLCGGVLFPVLLACGRGLRETERWRLGQSSSKGTRPASWWRDVAVLWEPPYRRRLVAGAAIWFAVNAWSSSCLFFFAYYVAHERGWGPAEVSGTLTTGYLLAVFGYATAGPMLDFAGRRVTASLYFTIGGAAALTCFLAESAAVITVAYVVVLGMHALWPIAATITSEIFPTHLRGLANGVVNNLLGRTGIVIAPALVGTLSTWLGSVGEAVALMAGVAFLCVPAVLFLISETSGQTLEEIS
jgi:putative MFS transporter